uniref:C1q domain-containing protein n=1 Tax=Periophthalmus magnuspinnatus TaxID=409849 RepID=A0A3B4AJS7_9GOBI
MATPPVRKSLNWTCCPGRSPEDIKVNLLLGYTFMLSRTIDANLKINHTWCLAFSARLGNDFPKAHRAIIFHQVLYNYPGDYNEKSGRFVCRVPGVYEFQMTLMIQKPSVGVDLMLNGEPLLHSFNTASGGNIMASGNTITPLKKGDEVYLVIIEGSNSILKDSQFNGKLLFTEDEDED